MESFIIRPSAWLVLRLVSRNPLVRRCDRIEAALIAVVIVLAVVATACAGVLGTLARDAEKQKYLAEANSRHIVTAIAVQDSTADVPPESSLYSVEARWQANGTTRTDTLTWPSAVKIGERLQIWIDTDGDVVDAPTEPARADADAVAMALAAWWFAMLILLPSFTSARAGIAHIRDRLWEDDLRCLLDSHDGRADFA